MTDPPTLYTTKQLADAAGLSYKRILQLVRQYDLGTLYGPTRLFTPEDLEIVTHRPDRRACRHYRAEIHEETAR